MDTRLIKLLISLTLQISGYGILFFVTNWQVGLGVMLVHWSINIEKKSKY